MYYIKSYVNIVKGQFMRKFFCLIVFLMGMVSMSAFGVTDNKTVYDFSFKKPNGEVLNLSDFRGKVLLIVNTASKCGFTSQYEGMEKIYQRYKNQGLEIIAIPSDDFGHQEPGSDEEIQGFCKLNFGVTFPVTSKEVVSGKSAHPFFPWISKELGFGSAPKWNFHKYLIDQDGKPVDFFYSITRADSGRLEGAIRRLIKNRASEEE